MARLRAMVVNQASGVPRPSLYAPACRHTWV